MGQRRPIHPTTPQKRFVALAADLLADHGVVIIPTDTSYAFVTAPGSKSAVERVSWLKEIDSRKKLFSLIVPDLSDLSRYALVDNSTYRLLKHFLPGPYTFVLPASREVPRILLTKRKTIGLRIPDHPVCREVAAAAGGGLLATTVRMPGDELPIADPEEIEERLIKHVDLFLDAGWSNVDLSTVIDLTDEEPQLIREGLGDAAAFS
jgi:tRNA threonylcarbamoyl adenosine modification protein (Sua5/YciO/YrdC/YwlC family)